MQKEGRRGRWRVQTASKSTQSSMNSCNGYMKYVCHASGSYEDGVRMRLKPHGFADWVVAVQRQVDTGFIIIVFQRTLCGKRCLHRMPLPTLLSLVWGMCLLLASLPPVEYRTHKSLSCAFMRTFSTTVRGHVGWSMQPLRTSCIRAIPFILALLFM